jgi:hypothetical protein
VTGKFRRALREQGFAALVSRALDRLAHALSGGRVRIVWYVLVAQPVGPTARVPARLGRDVATRLLAAGDPLLAQAPRPPAVLADRFAQGALCFGAERAGSLAGFLWVCPSRYLEDDVRCVFELPQTGDAWWDFDVWVTPDQRNGIIFARLWRAAHEHLRGVGAHWTCSRIVRHNTSSIAAHRRLGAITIGNALFLCGRRWQVTIARRPPFHFSRHTASMPVIPVQPPTASASEDKRAASPASGRP